MAASPAKEIASGTQSSLPLLTTYIRDAIVSDFLRGKNAVRRQSGEKVTNCLELLCFVIWR